MQRYIGLDVHSASCTMAVVDFRGKVLGRAMVLPTQVEPLVEAIKTIPRPRHLCIEEGTHSAWLYEMLSHHVDQFVVAARTERRGGSEPKDDERDAYELANRLRTNRIEKRVFKDLGAFKSLRQLVRAYDMQVQDSTRVQNRIKALYRSRGIDTAGKRLYAASCRDPWIARLPSEMRSIAHLLYREYDAVEALRKDAQHEMLREAKGHAATKLLASVPGVGPIRSAQLVAIIVSPHRFRTKRQLWKYSGFGIVMHTSSDWTQGSEGNWTRGKTHHTRGLSRDYNRTLKAIFKGAAGTVIQRADASCPLFQHYKRHTNKTKPNLAKLTIARQIAAICLAVWKEKIRYDPAKVKTTP